MVEYNAFGDIQQDIKDIENMVIKQQILLQ